MQSYRTLYRNGNDHCVAQEIDTHCMTVEGRFVGCSRGGGTWRLEEVEGDEVDGSEVRPRTQEGILVIRRNLEVVEESSRATGADRVGKAVCKVGLLTDFVRSDIVDIRSKVTDVCQKQRMEALAWKGL
jgi:hypothetical protein